MTKTLQIRLNEGLRVEAETVLQEIGLDVPSAVRLFLSQVVRTRSIPFELKASAIRVTEVAVDAAHQRQMDEIGALWAQRKPEQG